MSEMLRKQDVIDALLAKMDEISGKGYSADVTLGLLTAMGTVKSMNPVMVKENSQNGEGE